MLSRNEGESGFGIGRFTARVCIYYRDMKNANANTLRFLFSFSRLVQPVSNIRVGVCTPSRGNTWLLGVVCRDNDLADD